MVRVYKVEQENVTLDADLKLKSGITFTIGTNDVCDQKFFPDGKYLAVGFSK